MCGRLTFRSLNLVQGIRNGNNQTKHSRFSERNSITRKKREFNQLESVRRNSQRGRKCFSDSQQRRDLGEDRLQPGVPVRRPARRCQSGQFDYVFERRRDCVRQRHQLPFNFDLNDLICEADAVRLALDIKAFPCNGENKWQIFNLKQFM
jgi:hypothetical protein